MRFAYVIVGLCLGVILTCRQAWPVFAALEYENDKTFLAASLTGYFEGWTRGRDHAMAKAYWLSRQCEAELDWSRDYIKRLEKKKRDK